MTMRCVTVSLFLKTTASPPVWTGSGTYDLFPLVATMATVTGAVVLGDVGFGDAEELPPPQRDVAAAATTIG